MGKTHKAKQAAVLVRNTLMQIMAQNTPKVMYEAMKKVGLDPHDEASLRKVQEAMKDTSSTYKGVL